MLSFRIKNVGIFFFLVLGLELLFFKLNFTLRRRDEEKKKKKIERKKKEDKSGEEKEKRKQRSF